MTRFGLLAGLTAVALLAQETTIRTTVSLVVAPTTVTDRQDKYVNDLTENDFLLYDSGKPRSINVDVTWVPISLVIAVQSSSISAAALDKIHKIGSMIEPLIIGERGDAAVVAFDRNVRIIQDFTSDPHKLSQALKKIDSGDSGSRLIDAVVKSVKMLRQRPPNRRRVILLIGETRDRSSETRLVDAMSLAEQENVMIYPLSYSAYLTPFTARAGTLPASGGSGGVNLLAIFTEIARMGKENAAEAFSKYTGGRHLSFLKQRGLEEAVTRIGEELHSQYFLSFTPPAEKKSEFHEIRVEVRGRPELAVRTRPGYWMTAPQ